MKLLRLRIENFGVLQNCELELSDGLNVLHEKNGWGKSTLAVFIKSMFYGLPASTKRELDKNERKKYTPWQGGVFGGSLEFSCEKGSFRIERIFADKESGDTFALYDLSTNKPSDAFSKNIGEELFGIDADGFERSTYLSQRAGFERSENISIQSKLGDLLEDVNDMGNYDSAVEALEKRRKFYRMTGNRGAIAEEKQRMLSLRAELENCERVEQTAREKQSMRHAIAEQISEAQEQEALLQEKREKLVKAEQRRALLEEKGRMLGVLSELENERKRAEAGFCGFVPTEEELNAAKKTLDELREASATVRSVPESIPDAEELESLGALFSKGVPQTEALDAMIAQNEKLFRLRESQKRVNADLAAIPNDLRFANGVPTPEAFEEQFHALDRAKGILERVEQTELKATQEQQAAAGKRKLRMAIGCSVAAVGVILAVLSFFLDGILSTVLLSCGGAAIAVGCALVAIFSRKGEEQKAMERAAAEIEAQNATYAKELAQIEAFLAQCQTASDGDLYRTLTELSVAAIQSRANVHRRRSLREQLGEICRAAEQIRSRIATFVEKYDSDAEEAGFFGILTSLRGDAERYQYLCREEMRRRAQKEQAQARAVALQEELRPFLKRYDSTGSRAAAEIVASVSDSYVVYRGLCDDYRKKERALRDFIREKELDTPIPETDMISPEALAEEERTLQKTLTDLRETHTRLTMEIERLAGEIDRIPDLEAVLKSTEERLGEYERSCDTITATQKLLAEAKEALSTRYLGGMQKSFLEHLAEATDGDVPEAVIDSAFDVRTRAYGQSRELDSFSRGRKDIIRFCVRLSLTEELYREGEVPFLLLDDPFVNLDEEHLVAVQGMLEKLSQRYQIIHMICHEGRG